MSPGREDGIQGRGREVDEGELLAQVARGDHQAFQQFYRLNAPRVFRYALTLVRDRFLAEEVVQETMIAVWRGAKGFRRRSQVSTWVFGIARNQAWQVLRRAPQSLPEPEEELLGDVSPVEEKERVRKALAKLPPIEREVVVLTFYQGLPYRDIATILGIPEGTVKSRMFHARKHLRELLAPECERTLVPERKEEASFGQAGFAKPEEGFHEL